ncbi:hypothetical protein J7E61_23940 [Pseudomonas fluorescens]|uniref:Uncharacterized protein n=2 Tax=Pseudomonas fluorescens TaxID=294 RepID=A0A944HJ12_PSEFL|nr:hypothetical protein [Pseudomonas fluorescens]MBT2308372.1 hypothetical protein [Pseudomonas fluorescens]MBT2313583.1 hypothetical protein [Pseudomonas fluorescens]MBT2320196.1 hypothetical protein [Pseudomonas fluorescens]MBT2329608.1 hypothetical protein [Pseudomonas fluorescens]
MTAEINQLITHLGVQSTLATTQSRRAAIMNITNLHTGTITLHSTSIGNISIKALTAETASSPLYSVPGQSVVFAVDRPFKVQRYTLSAHQLEKSDVVIIDKNNPLIIDGGRTVFDYLPLGPEPGGLTGRINWPDRSADISVFHRVSLRKVAWLPHDESAARYLVSLELLETIQDPERTRVAEELVYHYHPAVAWKAFQVLYQADPQIALNYVPLLKQHQDTRLDNLLAPLEKAA